MAIFELALRSLQRSPLSATVLLVVGQHLSVRFARTGALEDALAAEAALRAAGKVHTTLHAAVRAVSRASNVRWGRSTIGHSPAPVICDTESLRLPT
jgi:hypothetical protein